MVSEMKEGTENEIGETMTIITDCKSYSTPGYDIDEADGHCELSEQYRLAKVKGNRKHDLDSKYHGLNGATAGKVFRVRGFQYYRRNIYLGPAGYNHSISGLREDQCNIYRSDATAMTEIDLEFLGLDLVKFIGGISKGASNETAFILGRQNLWKIEQELEKVASMKRVGGGAETGTIDKLFESIQYDVPIEGMLVEKEVAAEESDFNLSVAFPSGSSFQGSGLRKQEPSAHKIYEILHINVESCSVKARLIGEYPTEIPVEITERGLVEFRDCRMRTAYGAGGTRNARCRDMSSGCFSVPRRVKNQGLRGFLEVDLGETKWIHAVSTQARIPRRQISPDHVWVRENLPRRTTWRGPLFTTFDHKRDKSALHNRFYKLFRLEYRSGSGAPRISLGMFADPANNVEEKVQFLEDPIFCRYIRFFPMDGDNENRWKRYAGRFKGMKVAVFGQEPSSDEVACGMKNDSKAVDDTTTCSCTIFKRKENRNRHFQPRTLVQSHVTNRYRYDYRSGYHEPNSRANKKKDWKYTIKEMVP